MAAFTLILRDWISPWRSYLAEFLGTYIFVLMASCAVLVASDFGNVRILTVAFACGLSLVVAMYATFHLSGANLNPSITLSLWFAQRISSKLAIFYILSQILASFAAALTIFAIFGNSAFENSLGGPASSASLGGPVIGDGVTLSAALIVEAVMCAVLVFVYFATMVDRRGANNFGPLAVGLTLLVLTIITLPISGAALNPARAIGPAVLANNYAGLLVFVTGPFVGSIFGLVYEYVFLRKGKR